MRLLSIFVLISLAGLGCGGSSDSGDSGGAVPGLYDRWMATPEDVIKGVMYAYETRNDSLYAALLAAGFRYQFEPPGADSTDVLSWGREEEVLATGSLFQTPELESVALNLSYDAPQPVSEDRVRMAVSGGELRLNVKEKDPTVVALNRQEIFFMPHPQNRSLWQIVAWYDYPSPD